MSEKQSTEALDSVIELINRPTVDELIARRLGALAERVASYEDPEIDALAA